MLTIQGIDAFSDNYIWLFYQQGSQQAFVVDPGDAEVVSQYLDRHSLVLAGILITHHHWDHTNGVDALLARDSTREIPVFGPANSPASVITHPVKEGDQLELAGCKLNVLEVPGHTLDHIAYFVDQDAGQGPVVFCGDTLFAGGCGRLFEGTPAQMHHSLSRLAALPDTTQVYCAHEYTLANLAFAQAVEPDNTALQERLTEVTALREAGRPSIPTRIDLEKATNPFLRCGLDTVKKAAIQQQAAIRQQTPLESNNPEQTFAAIRAWKDNF